MGKASHSFSAFSIITVFVLLVLLGVASLPFLSVQLFPSRTFASVTVKVQLYGASTGATETEVTVAVESVLSRLKGIRRISSVSESEWATVRIDLDKYTDPEMFRFEAASVLKQLYPQLPSNASFPEVYLNRPDNGRFQPPILEYTLVSPGSTQEMAALAEETIRPQLGDLSGIDRLDISGRTPQQLAIYLDPQKVHAIGMDAQGVQQQLTMALAHRELGVRNMDDSHYAFSILPGVKSMQELQRLPITRYKDRIFTLSDVAILVENDQKKASYYRVNGQELVTFLFYAEDNVNSIRLAKQIRERMEQIQETLPRDYALSLQYDSTQQIKDELGKIYLRTSLSIAILMAFVLLITRNMRYLLLVIFALASNVLLSCIVYYLVGLDIHLYSLAGITISLGLVIDNVIVIVEDIRHTGRNRIFAAILASTLTALGAISVVFLLEDEQRVNLIDFGWAIIINLLVSLPIAYYLIPALLEVFPVSIQKTTLLWRRRRRLVRFNRFYIRQLDVMVRWKWGFAVIFVLVFGLPLFLLPQKVEHEGRWASLYNSTLGSEWYNRNLREQVNRSMGGMLYEYISHQGQAWYALQNEEDAVKQTQLFVQISMPAGATLDQMNAVCLDFERYIGQYKEAIALFTASVSGGMEARIQILFHPNVVAGFPYRLKSLLERHAILSGAADFSVYGVGRGFNNAINFDSFDSAIVLKGYNYQQLQRLALIVRDSLLVHKRVDDVLISARREYGQPVYYEHVVRFQRPEWLALHHVGRYSLSQEVMRLGEKSATVGFLSLRDASPQTVRMYYNQDHHPQVWSAMELPLSVTDSTFMRLQYLSERDRVKVGSRMVRENQEYILYVNYRFIGTGQLNDIVNNKVVKSVQPLLPFGYTIVRPQWWGWGSGDTGYLWFIPLILLIIYMICAVLLESLTQPLAVILIIPFSFIGVFFIFRILGLRFDQGGYAALLMLSGLVTNAALYILNDLNFLNNKRGYAREDTAIREYAKAFQSKAMPIMVTTSSAILSLLPFMIIGEEKGFWFTLSAGTIGGLLFSLLGVYLVIPLCVIRQTSIGKKKEK